MFSFLFPAEAKSKSPTPSILLCCWLFSTAFLAHDVTTICVCVSVSNQQFLVPHPLPLFFLLPTPPYLPLLHSLYSVLSDSLTLVLYLFSSPVWIKWTLRDPNMHHTILAWNYQLCYLTRPCSTLHWTMHHWLNQISQSAQCMLQLLPASFCLSPRWTRREMKLLKT